MRSAAAGGQDRRPGRLERDDARVAPRVVERARHPHQHPGGSRRPAEGVDGPDLLDQLHPDLAVPVERVGVVELVGPEGIRLPEEFLHPGVHSLKQTHIDLAIFTRYDFDVRAEYAHGL